MVSDARDLVRLLNSLWREKQRLKRVMRGQRRHSPEHKATEAALSALEGYHARMWIRAGGLHPGLTASGRPATNRTDILAYRERRMKRGWLEGLNSYDLQSEIFESIVMDRPFKAQP